MLNRGFKYVELLSFSNPILILSWLYEFMISSFISRINAVKLIIRNITLVNKPTHNLCTNFSSEMLSSFNFYNISINLIRNKSNVVAQIW